MNQEDQRIGQRAFNALYDSHPHIADKIRGSVCDPFHQDKRLSLFYIRVAELLLVEDDQE